MIDTIPEPNINILKTPGELADSVVQWLKSASDEAIQKSGKCSIALSGGSTPKAIYALMAGESYLNKFDWKNINIFFGDERTVAQDHPDSNFKMAKDVLLDHVPIPDNQIFPMFAKDETPAQNAARYEEALKTVLPATPDGFGEFDVVLLGMGEDGHTASLFPGTSIVNESRRWVAEVFVEKLNTWRISITFPIINHARNVAIIAVGESKASLVSEVIKKKPGKYPIEFVQPAGRLFWFLDHKAAAGL